MVVLLLLQMWRLILVWHTTYTKALGYTAVRAGRKPSPKQAGGISGRGIRRAEFLTFEPAPSMPRGCPGQCPPTSRLPRVEAIVTLRALSNHLVRLIRAYYTAVFYIVALLPHAVLCQSSIFSQNQPEEHSHCEKKHLPQKHAHHVSRQGRRQGVRK